MKLFKWLGLNLKHTFETFGPVIFLIIISLNVFSQPTVLGTQLVNGSYTTYDLVTRGAGVRYVRLQAISGAASGTANWEFATGSSGSTNYSTNWRPYTAGQILGGYNNYIDPLSTASSARYNTGFGGQSGLLPTVTANNYYTLIVGGNNAANNFMSVLETNYNPTSFTSVSQSPTTGNVLPSQAVTITVNFTASLNSSEYAYLRYSNDGFATSTIAAVSMSGSTGTATIPATTNTSGATVSYYLFTSNQGSAPTSTQADYFSLNIYNASGQNVSGGGSNFSYTVATAGIIVQYSGMSTSTTAASTTTAGNTSNISLTINGGQSFSNPGCTPNAYRTAAAAFQSASASNYLQFTVKPSDYYQFSVTSISIDPRRTASGPDVMRIDYNANNSGWVTGTDINGIGTQTTCPVWSTQTISPSGLLISDATNGLQIRVYFWAPNGTPSGAGNLDFTNLTVSGAVQANPTTPPSVTSFSVAAPGSGGSGYVSNLITLSGSGFTGVSTLKIGGAGGTIVSTFSVVDDNTITFPAIDATGTIYVSNAGGNSGSVSSYTSLGYITITGATSWNVAASWLGGTIPPAGAATTVAHNLGIATAIAGSPSTIAVLTGVTLDVNNTAGALTATTSVTNSGTINFSATGSLTAATFTNNSTLSWTAAGTLNIPAGGSLTNNGTFTRGAGLVNFAGAGIINGTSPITFNNLTINTGALTMATQPVIDGIFKINGGNVGSVGGFSPIYTLNSTLFYGATYTRYLEWSAVGAGTIGSTPGYPNNVTVNTGTLTVLNGDAGTSRAMAGSLTVNTGATFTTGAINAIVTVGGDLISSGTGIITLSTSNQPLYVNGNVAISGTLTLSTVSGGDIGVAGNWTNSGTFTSNTREVTFNGTLGQQTIIGTSTFDYLKINNTSAGNATVVINANTTVNNRLTLTSGRLIAGAYNITLLSASTLVGGSASSFVSTDGAGSFIWTYASSATVSRTYPVGTSSPSIIYSPVVFTNFNNTGIGGTLGLRALASADPNINNSLPAPSYITRYFIPSISSLNAFSVASAQVNYASPSEVTGTESAISLSIWNGTVSDWQNFGGAGASGSVTSALAITNTAFTTGSTISARATTQLYFRTSGTGPSDWATTSTWETSPNASFIPLSAALSSPNYLNAFGINVRTGHTVNTSTVVNAGVLTIDGTLNLNSGTYTLVRTSGTDMTISSTGRLNLYNTTSNSISFGTGTASVVNGYVYNAVLSAATNYNGTFSFADGSTFENAANGGTVPPATWNGGVAGSTVYFTGNTSGIAGNLNQSFYNFKWNCAQTANINFGLGSLSPAMAINGDLTVQNTGSGKDLILFSQTAGGTLTVAGNTYISGGTFSVFGSGTYTANRTVNINLQKDLYLSGSGKLNLTATAAGLSGTHYTNVYLKGNLDVQGTAQITQPTLGSAVSSFVFNNSSAVQTYTSTNAAALNSGYIGWGVGDITKLGNCTNTLELHSNFITNAGFFGSVIRIYNKATLSCPGELYVSGAGALFSPDTDPAGFTLFSGSNILIGSKDGITATGGGAVGNIQTAASRNFNAAANYTYNSSSANQVTGNGLPATITGSLTIANSAAVGSNVVTLTTNNTTTATFNLNSGLFASGTGKNLNISGGGNINGNGGNNPNLASAGTITFAGNGNINGNASPTTSLYAVLINGTVSFRGSGSYNPTIYKLLQINNGGKVDPYAPFYNSASTLVYNSGGTYARSFEWGQVTPALAGYPYNVAVQNGTVLNMATNAPTNLEIGGNLDIGSEVMGVGTGTGQVLMNASVLPLKVLGNLTIGTNTTTGSKLKLSTEPGGGLVLAGDFNRYNALNYFDNNVNDIPTTAAKVPVVELNGSANTSVNVYATPAAQNFYKLKMNKTGLGDMTLNCISLIENSLDLTGGKINTTSTNLMTMETVATVSGSPGANSYINGPLAKRMAVGETSEFLYPIGKASATPVYNPCSVVPVNIAAITTTFTSEYFAGAHQNYAAMGSTLLGITNKEYWDISKLTGDPAANSARVKLTYKNPGSGNWIYYNATGPGGFYAAASDPCAACNVAVVHRDAATSTWDFTASTSNFNAALPEYRFYTDNGDIYSAPVTSFSPFTTGYSYNVILLLPVRLLNFKGHLSMGDGKLEWHIADSKSLAGFALEYSTQGHNYKKLADIKGSAATAYDFRHLSLPPGTNYYRLLVKEKNGKSFYSQVVLINVGNLHTHIVGLAGNPVKSMVTPVIVSASDQAAEARVTDAAGRLMFRQQGRLKAGLNQWQLSNSRYSSGVYFISIITADGIKATLQFVKE